jgi:hypothetical protein
VQNLGRDFSQRDTPVVYRFNSRNQVVGKNVQSKSLEKNFSIKKTDGSSIRRRVQNPSSQPPPKPGRASRNTACDSLEIHQSYRPAPNQNITNRSLVVNFGQPNPIFPKDNTLIKPIYKKFDPIKANLLSDHKNYLLSNSEVGRQG